MRFGERFESDSFDSPDAGGGGLIYRKDKLATDDSDSRRAGNKLCSSL